MTEEEYQNKLSSLYIHKRRYTNWLLTCSILFFIFANAYIGLWSWKDAFLMLTAPISIWHLLCKFLFKRLR